MKKNIRTVNTRALNINSYKKKKIKNPIESSELYIIYSTRDRELVSKSKKKKKETNVFLHKFIILVILITSFSFRIQKKKKK